MKKLITRSISLLLPTIGSTLLGQEQERKVDPLDSLLFLEGTWHGEGKGPCGACEFETKVLRRSTPEGDRP